MLLKRLCDWESIGAARCTCFIFVFFNLKTVCALMLHCQDVSTRKNSKEEAEKEGKTKTKDNPR